MERTPERENSFKIFKNSKKNEVRSGIHLFLMKR
jgi:hypothetical protein